MIYNSRVLNIYQQLAHVGPINQAKLDQGSKAHPYTIKQFEAGSIEQGELIKLEVAFEGRPDHDLRIIDAKFQVFGCGYAIAMAELICRSMIEQGNLSNAFILCSDLTWLEEAVDLPINKVSTLMLFEDLAEAFLEITP